MPWFQVAGSYLESTCLWFRYRRGWSSLQFVTGFWLNVYSVDVYKQDFDVEIIYYAIVIHTRRENRIGYSVRNSVKIVRES